MLSEANADIPRQAAERLIKLYEASGKAAEAEAVRAAQSNL